MASVSVPKSISSIKNGIRIIVKAKPGAKQANVVGIDDEAIAIQINAPPREGAANAALIEFVADIVGVKKSNTSLEAGGKSRSKVVDIQTEQTTEEVYKKFTSFMNSDDP